MSKFRMQFKWDEEEIIKRNEHSLIKMYNVVDRFCEKYGLIKVDKGSYVSPGKISDYGAIWKVIMSLDELDWFIQYLVSWTYFDDEDDLDILYEHNKKIKKRLGA